MKKHLFNTIAICLATAPMAFAQPVLTASGVNPVIGDVYTLNYGNYVSPGNAGASQSWNLAGITATSVASYTVGTVASVANSSSFTAGSNMQMNDGSKFAFLNISASAYQNSGSRVGSTDIVYSNNEDILHYPFSMSNTFTDTWSAIVPVSMYTFSRTGTTTVTYDGYGSLVLPVGTINNVARVHIIQNYKDSSSTLGTQHYFNDEYIWLSNTYHQPIAGLTSLSYTSGTTTGSATSGFYANPVLVTTSIAENNAVSAVSAFPNPASEAISFSLRSGFAIQAISIFDLHGKLVAVEKIDQPANAATIKLDGLSAGIYMAKITAENGSIETQKISVVK